mmetsp:Transcript_41051/g.52916  ORF Transcript_41051/g.52916 Transcript_41051/m.52916 type:complete len:178 (+) Transcript_41051:1635-2168(+)
MHCRGDGHGCGVWASECGGVVTRQGRGDLHPPRDGRSCAGGSPEDGGVVGGESEGRVFEERLCGGCKIRELANGALVLSAVPRIIDTKSVGGSRRGRALCAGGPFMSAFLPSAISSLENRTSVRVAIESHSFMLFPLLDFLFICCCICLGRFYVHSGMSIQVTHADAFDEDDSILAQ